MTSNNCGVPKGRAGHTLLEILLALGLSIILMSAVYSALDMHWRYATAGQIETEQSQVARALLEQMSRDLRCVVFAKRPSDADEAARPSHRIGNIGLVGDSQQLVINVNQLTPPSLTRDNPIDKQRLDVHHQTIHWHIHTDATVAEFRDSNQSAEWNQTATKGLVRQRHQATRADVLLSESDSEIQFNEIVAAEVKQLRIRYFDGQQWLLAWNTVTADRLPRAVEITIGFGEQESELLHEENDRAARQYQLVVAIPNPGV